MKLGLQFIKSGTSGIISYWGGLGCYSGLGICIAEGNKVYYGCLGTVVARWLAVRAASLIRSFDTTGPDLAP